MSVTIINMQFCTLVFNLTLKSKWINIAFKGHTACPYVPAHLALGVLSPQDLVAGWRSHSELVRKPGADPVFPTPAEGSLSSLVSTFLCLHSSPGSWCYVPATRVSRYVIVYDLAPTFYQGSLHHLLWGISSGVEAKVSLSMCLLKKLTVS